ncbi:ATP-dependent RNA helicase RhlE [Labilithrix luteola]|uniref:ATP-dependent RNA helicase RhlE n=1 Tax=Labilithrix luteola TaxID=1391654 RepID=A0A0K1Q366_9BACT|nr:DEAD/DEAH box helicase [Labilithrix luteola]AKV00281.1 ATP-dependent RNA helicase RhlE [Labilithrix luteola]
MTTSDDVTFVSLGLSGPLLRALEELGHERPRAIQAAVISAILDGRDVWASAETGSGKTAAFVLPLLEKLGTQRRATTPGRPRPLRALILVPTRELAAQIGEAIDDYARHLPERPKTCIAFGGVSINPQLMSLRGGADIVVATPGRLLDLVSHNALRLASVEMLVLDEADRLLSLGFADELARVLSLLGRRQTLLFSATFPPAVRALAEKVLAAPLRIDVARETVLGSPDANIVQRAIEVDETKRTPLLRHLLATEGWSRVLVFVESRHSANHVAEKLQRAQIAAAPFHGDLTQGTRTTTLEAFKDERLQVLVATDVASRGIDITALPAVVNYDLPRSAADYVHRIGRTGRAGEKGVAVSFVTPDAEPHFRLIEKRHRIRVERERIAGFEPTPRDPAAASAAPVRDPHGGVKGKRKSKKDKLREAAARAAK